jgi:carbon-monoxide dehydrogenase medium subunit
MIQEMHHNHMTNSHILVQEFEYFEPNTVDKAIALLKTYGKKASLLAGGTHLFIMMKMEREAPKVVININKISDLDSITQNAQGDLVIGSRTTIRAIYNHPYIRSHYTALAQACAAFGSTQIQIMGTIGGNICNGSPASDTIPALLAFDAVLHLKGPDGERQILLKDFLLGPGKIDLHEGEILISVTLPAVPASIKSTYIKLSRVAADLAKISLGLVLNHQDDHITDIRIAYGAVAPTVIRIPDAEACLKGQKLSTELLERAAKIASENVSPITDARSTAWYRRELARVLLLDGFSQLYKADVPKQMAFIPQNPAPDQEKIDHIAKDDQQEITFFVNGKKHHLYVSPNELLINVLRERLQYTGTKYGCGVGECSACTIMLEGKSVLSCLLLAVEINNKHITTVEGLQQPDGELDPLQESFINQGAFQCGYCTPGILMTVKGLLNEIPHPAEDEVRDYLKGNRCRCTGYTSIVRAVLKAVNEQA